MRRSGIPQTHQLSLRHPLGKASFHMGVWVWHEGDQSRFRSEIDFCHRSKWGLLLAERCGVVIDHRSPGGRAEHDDGRSGGNFKQTIKIAIGAIGHGSRYTYLLT
jgi:hypothetical protein